MLNNSGYIGLSNLQADTVNQTVSRIKNIITTFEYEATLPLEPVMYNNFWTVIKDDNSLNEAVTDFINNRNSVYNWLKDILAQVTSNPEIAIDYTEIDENMNTIYSQKKIIIDYFFSIWKLNPVVYTSQGFSFYGHTFMQTYRDNIVTDKDGKTVYDIWVRINPEAPVTVTEQAEASKITSETAVPEIKKSNSVLPFAIAGVIIALMNN